MYIYMWTWRFNRIAHQKLVHIEEYILEWMHDPERLKKLAVFKHYMRTTGLSSNKRHLIILSYC